MKEQELNTMMSVVSDPICNVYKIRNRKDLEEIGNYISQIIQNKGKNNQKERLKNIEGKL